MTAHVSYLTFVILSIFLVGVTLAIAAYLVAKRRKKNADVPTIKRKNVIEKVAKNLVKRWMAGGDDDDSVTKVLTPSTNRTIAVSNRGRDSVASILSNFSETPLLSKSLQHHSPQNSSSPMRKQMSLQLPSINVTSTSPTASHNPFISPRRQSHQAFLSPIPSPSRRSSNGSLMDEDLLCGLNPSLYRRRYSAGASVSSREDIDDDDDDDDEFSFDYLGRVKFSVEYSKKTEKLRVVLHMARRLPLKNNNMPDSCDPFFKLVLLPDLRSQVKTTFKKKTNNPKFNESFVFQVHNKDFSERTLKLTAFDVDKLRRHNVIGHVIYPLKEMGDEEKVTVIRELEVEEQTDEKGEMLISLKYNNVTERLAVGVFEARKIKKPAPTASSDFYLKVVFMKNNTVMKKKKSAVVKGDEEPKFNISFTFKQIPESLLGTGCVVLSLVQRLAAHKDKQVGRVVIGSFMHARGKELEHWEEVNNKHKDTITFWHNIT